PSSAVSTSKYSASRRASRSFTLAGMSSTTRIRAVIPFAPVSCVAQIGLDGLDEFRNGDRLRHIGFAAALPDALLVPLHGEGGDGNDRDDMQFVILLQPFRHLEARNLRQLDI